jgi:hypothetical protein
MYIMASTRNCNTPGDYNLEQKADAQSGAYLSYGSYGVPTSNYHPGDGLLGARTCRNVLDSNACDVESTLFGIGANNLVTPRAAATPQPKVLKSLSIMDKTPLVMPKPLEVSDKNRPMYLN